MEELVKDVELLIETGRMPLTDDQTGSIDAARILMVEEDSRAALLIGEMLRSVWPEGLVLSHAERLGDATQELLERGATCVLLDVSLPDTDELSAVEQIRTAAPNVPIVVLADGTDEDLALLAIRAGAQDYLTRSELNPASLARSLRYAIERKRSEVQLARLALHDPLTGLPNRALFLDRLTVALDRSRRTSASVAVLFLDVDNFKQVNDSLGHAAGDRLLVGLAERLRAMLRPMDTVARFGGDEFTFLFEDLESEREVVLIAERISRTARMPVRLEEGEMTVTVSIGIAMVSDPAIPAETVIRESDVAMYRAKELGRSRYELFDESSRQRAMQRLELESALRHAVDRSELRVHYQPKFSLADSHRPTGFEALVRWQHPERGLISPSEFIPLAEETGIVLQIGEYVIFEALRQLERWREVRSDLTMAVNLSTRQLQDASLSSMVVAGLNAFNLDPTDVCLEISDASVATSPDVALRTMRGLKGTGASIAIDDFGTGSSSLWSLRRLPVDLLKIDESFVSSLDGDGEASSIVGAVVELGHALGLSVVAEGVETDMQLEELRELGCDAAQGFLLSKPMTEQEADELLSSTR
ncbi:MAG: EAL domain-containing protein [Solirubrobacterales bacterium]|nr:EAL domain-containing protein [Solirubrobacterales bacterium]